jgi:protein O-GlcNAc transferase
MSWDFINEQQAGELIETALRIEPQSVVRQALTHSGNAIFRVVLSDQRSVVLRVSSRPGLFGYTESNLQSLRELGLPVQSLLARGATLTGGSYIILNWLPGRDLMYELPRMTPAQMARVARQIVEYQQRAATLPISRGFGWAPIGKNAPSQHWTDIFGAADASIVSTDTSPLEKLRGRLRAVRQSIEPYFSTIKPICFLDDLTTKNVLIENGELTGIIDVDFVCYGDVLMSVGTTLASLAADVGDAGEFYGQELVRCWNPSADGLRAIHFYTALSTVGWINVAESSGDSALIEKLMPIADRMLRVCEADMPAPLTTEQLLDFATQRHRAGDLSEARRSYQQVLSASPDHVVGRFRLGLLELQQGNFHAALPMIEFAAKSSPGEFRYQFGLGEIHTALGQWDQAITAYRLVLTIDRRSADAYFALGNAHHSLRDFKNAIDAYQNALQIQPDFASAMSNLGTAYQAVGEHERAINLLRAAVKLEPLVSAYAVNLSAALCGQNQFAEAAQLLAETLKRDEHNADAAYNLGNALHGLGRSHEAVEQYKHAIVIRPGYADAMNNLGNVYKELGEFKLAADAYESAIHVQPGLIAAVNNAGCLLRALGRLDEAEKIFRRGLEQGDHSALLDNLGNVLKDSGRLDEAIDCFAKAVALDPTNSATHSNLVYALSFQSEKAEPILAEALNWNARHVGPLKSEKHDHSPNKKIRIGYVSPDFRDHCQSLFTIPLLSNHDHDAFEIYCYSSVERPDEYTKRIAGYADVWREFRSLDDSALAALIRKDRINILVDLTMHMASGRPLVFARKPAPVQIAWLAYPGTTGISAIDYRLTDPRLDPPGFESHYTERTIHLPDSFWCYDPLNDQLQVNELPALSRGYVTLGCLNNPCKLTDHTLHLWAGVMHAIPTARLLLMAPPGSGRTHLQHRLAAKNIAAERVDFVAYRPRADYLRTYHDIDLGLDTFPYNGHTTSLDSFWMGVPVVTRVGQTCVGRGGLSQLFNLDLTDLAAETDEAFVQIAIRLAGNLPRLKELRHQLRARLKSSPLMDGNRFARNIETVYRSRLAWQTS